ncbi:MAG: glycosyltransferase [Nitrososphaerota archaeon]|jgi:glycosyltransferase involved in cell wall biosynthesis|nr:glycosyltransferase [Nitrososphaerota archaeon]MDG6932390.1 glycosyltransferase [Nitrososphaerota archaeon]MDG6935733.1 glycosyltransferase [Nitrososphaerota archaeon]MDG6944719.1 glycosyltransferase [Nitrososphaerota archaeon]
MVVVSLITRNSYSRLGESGISLQAVLDSTLQVPYRDMILVDDSDDRTGEFVKSWAESHGISVRISPSDTSYGKPTRATARQTAIDIFLKDYSDDWIFFVDDDAVLNEGWWEEGSKYASEPKVGLIWGYNFDPVPYRRRFLEGISIDYKNYLKEVFLGRGGTHDTMFRREALAQIGDKYGKIPRELHIFEDAWLCHSVRCLGWDYRIVDKGVLHYAPWNPKKSKEVTGELARLAYRYGFSDSNEKISKYDSLTYALVAWLRPIAGFPLMASTYIKQYGWGKGFPAAFNRQYDKLRIRLIWLWLRLTSGKPGRTCLVLEMEGQKPAR